MEACRTHLHACRTRQYEALIPVEFKRDVLEVYYVARVDKPSSRLQWRKVRTCILALLSPPTFSKVM